MTTVHLTLPVEAELPEAFLKATPDVAYEMLMLGALVYETVQTQRSEADAKERAAAYAKEIATLKATKEAEVAALKARYQQETATIQATLEKQKAAELAVLQERHMMEQRQKDAAHHSIVTELRGTEGRLAELAARKASVDAEFQAQIQHIKATEFAASERIVAAKDAELRRLVAEKEAAEAERRASQTTIQALSERIHALTEAIHRKPATAKEKGSAFEAHIDELVRQCWGAIEGFSIADVSTRGHIGDRIVTVGRGDLQTILLECKDYSDIVPRSEVEKFFKDVSTNHKVQIGIFISRATAIQGHSHRNAIEFVIQSEKLHIFVNAFDKLEPLTTMAVLMGWIRYWSLVQKPATDVEDKAAAIRIISDLVEKSTQAKRDLAVHISHVDDFKAWVKRQMDDSGRQLQQALLDLQRGVQPTSNVLVTDSSSSFYDVAGDAKKQKWIETVKAVLVPGSSVKLSDIADRLSSESMSSVAVRSHIEPLFLESVLEKKKGFPTLVLGVQLSRAL